MAYAKKPDKPADKKDFLSEAKRRFKMALDATSESRELQKDDVKFAAGSPDNHWQWPDALWQSRTNASNPGGPRPCLTINKLPQHIRIVTNEQRMNRPSVKVLPVDDKGDPEVAEVLNGIIRHIEVNSDADVAYDTAAESQVGHGEGYFRILTEYCDELAFEQDIIICPIKNSFSVYLDPVGLKQDSTGRKCEWGFITDKIHKDHFESKFPDAQKTDWDTLGSGDESGWMDGDFVVIAEYFCVKEEPKQIVLWSDGSVTDNSKPLKPGLTLVQTRQTTVKKVMWSKMTGLEILEEQDWAGKYIPIVRMAGNEVQVDGKTHVSGIVRNAKDAQRMGNYFESMDTEMVALAPKAPHIGAVGQFETMSDEWGNANVVPYSRLEYDPIAVDGIVLPPPERSMPPMASSAIIQAKLATWDNLQATVGQYNPSLGAEAKEKSGVAINARQRQSDIGTFHYLGNEAVAIRHGGRIILDLIPKIYDTQRVARIIGLDGEPDHCQLDPTQDCAVKETKDKAGAVTKIYNPNIGRYDVTVTTGPGYTTKRQEAAEFMAQVLQGNKELMAVMGDLYFEMLDVPGADRIADRLRKSMPPELVKEDDENPGDPEVQKQQIQQAAQALGQKEAEINAQMDQADQLTQTAAQAEEAANKKLAEVHEAQLGLEAEKESVVAAKRDLQSAQKLADLTIENNLLKAKEQVREVAEQAQNEIAASQQPEGVEKPEQEPAISAQVIEAMIRGQEQIGEAVQALLKVNSADRETMLIPDEQGNPVGARSRLVMN